MSSRGGTGEYLQDLKVRKYFLNMTSESITIWEKLVTWILLRMSVNQTTPFIEWKLTHRLGENISKSIKKIKTESKQENKQEFRKKKKNILRWPTNT